MGLRCLLGHDFTEPTAEREREERGDEVVVTIREVKECRRCGETQVITENTEVTSVDRTGDRGRTGPESNTGLFSGRPDAGGSGTNDFDAGGGSGVRVDEAEAADIDEGFDHPHGDPEDVDPSIENDAEIIREGPSDAPEEPSDAPSGEPDVGSRASDARDEDGNERTAESTAADAGPAGNVERGHGEWPDADRGNAAGVDEESTGARGGWPDPDGADRTARDEVVDSEGSAASEARTGVVSGEERDGSGGTAATGDEDVEFIDADGRDDADGPSTWPDQTGEDEGFDAEVGTGGSDGDVTVDGNLTPRVNPDADPGEDVEFIEAESSNASTRESRPSPGVSPTGGSDGASGSASSPAGPAKNGSSSGSAADRSPRTHEVELTTTVGDRETEYVCPECGARERVGASSMRAGDICPECKRGYIEERELE